MNKQLIIACPLLALLLHVKPLFASTQVDFKGTLIALPCQITTDTQSQTVDFGSVVSKTFINQQRTAGKSFSIKLTGCDLTVGNTVSVMFDGAEDAIQPGAFAVSEANRGIAIVLENDRGESIVPQEKNSPEALMSGETTLNYKAFVSAPNFSNVVPGDFSATINFYLEYQ